MYKTCVTHWIFEKWHCVSAHALLRPSLCCPRLRAWGLAADSHTTSCPCIGPEGIPRLGSTLHWWPQACGGPPWDDPSEVLDPGRIVRPTRSSRVAVAERSGERLERTMLLNLPLMLSESKLPFLWLDVPAGFAFVLCVHSAKPTFLLQSVS